MHILHLVPVLFSIVIPTSFNILMKCFHTCNKIKPESSVDNFKWAPLLITRSRGSVYSLAINVYFDNTYLSMLKTEDTLKNSFTFTNRESVFVSEIFGPRFE